MFKWKEGQQETVYHTNVKKSITSSFARALKVLQQKHVQCKEDEFVYSNDDSNNLCSSLEAAFLHGLKDSVTHKLTAYVGLATATDNIAILNFWTAVVKFTHADVVKQLLRLTQINSEIGYCRAWVRLALNDGLMESYLHSMIVDTKTLQYFYNAHAFLRDHEQPGILKNYLTGLMSLDFKLSFNSSVLNYWNNTTLQLIGALDHHSAPAPVIGQAQTGSSGLGGEFQRSPQRTPARKEESSKITTIVQPYSDIGNTSVVSRIQNLEGSEIEYANRRIHLSRLSISVSESSSGSHVSCPDPDIRAPIEEPTFIEQKTKQDDVNILGNDTNLTHDNDNFCKELVDGIAAHLEGTDMYDKHLLDPLVEAHLKSNISRKNFMETIISPCHSQFKRGDENSTISLSHPLSKGVKDDPTDSPSHPQSKRIEDDPTVSPGCPLSKRVEDDLTVSPSRPLNKRIEDDPTVSPSRPLSKRVEDDPTISPSRPRSKRIEDDPTISPGRPRSRRIMESSTVSYSYPQRIKTVEDTIVSPGRPRSRRIGEDDIKFISSGSFTPPSLIIAENTEKQNYGIINFDERKAHVNTSAINRQKHTSVNLNISTKWNTFQDNSDGQGFALKDKLACISTNQDLKLNYEIKMDDNKNTSIYDTHSSSSFYKNVEQNMPNKKSLQDEIGEALIQEEFKSFQYPANLEEKGSNSRRKSHELEESDEDIDETNIKGLSDEKQSPSSALHDSILEEHSVHYEDVVPSRGLHSNELSKQESDVDEAIEAELEMSMSPSHYGNSLNNMTGWSSEIEALNKRKKQQEIKRNRGESFATMLRGYTTATPDLAHSVTLNDVIDALPCEEDSLDTRQQTQDSPSRKAENAQQEESGLDNFEILKSPTEFYCGQVEANMLTHSRATVSAGKTKSARMYFLFNVAREHGLSHQNFACKGCARPIGIIYGPTRLCEFDGGLYCYDCHQNNEAYIPSSILFDWDFRKKKVCQKNYTFLMDLEDQALYDVEELNPKLYTHVTELQDLKTIRQQLVFLKSYLFACSQKVTESMRQKVWPREHLYERRDLYSLMDFLQVQSGSLQKLLKELVKSSSQHVYECNLCTQKGFVCEICRNPQVIFPFEVETTIRCATCKAVYHKTCMTDTLPCPKCERWGRHISTNNFNDGNPEDYGMSPQT